MIEIGRYDFSRSVVRTLDIGGMVWGGAEEYDSLDDALRSLDDGIAAAREKNGSAKESRTRGTYG